MKYYFLVNSSQIFQQSKSYKPTGESNGRALAVARQALGARPRLARLAQDGRAAIQRAARHSQVLLVVLLRLPHAQHQLDRIAHVALANHIRGGLGVLLPVKVEHAHKVARAVQLILVCADVTMTAHLLLELGEDVARVDAKGVGIRVVVDVKRVAADQAFDDVGERCVVFLGLEILEI